MLNYIKNVVTLIKSLKASDSCFGCALDCDAHEKPIKKKTTTKKQPKRLKREGILFWGKTPIFSVRGEKAPAKRKIKLTPDMARQKIFGWDKLPIEVAKLRKAAGKSFWETLGF